MINFRNFYAQLNKIVRSSEGRDDYKRGTYPVTIRLEETMQNRIEVRDGIRQLMDCNIDLGPGRGLSRKHNTVSMTVGDGSPHDYDIAVVMSRQYRGIEHVVSLLCNKLNVSGVVTTDENDGCGIILYGQHLTDKRIANETVCKIASGVASLLMNCPPDSVNIMHELVVGHSVKVQDVSPHNRVELDYVTMEKLNFSEHERVFLLNPETGLFTYGIVKLNELVKENMVTLASKVRVALGFPRISSNLPSVVIGKSIGCIMSEVGTQRWSQLKDGQITVSAESYDALMCTGATLFQVKNLISGWALDIPVEKLIRGTSGRDVSFSETVRNKIQLSYVQRQLLDYRDAPVMIHKYYLHRFKKVHVEEQHRQLFLSLYDEENVVSHVPFSDRHVIRRILDELHPHPVVVYPIWEEEIAVPPRRVFGRWRRRLWSVITDSLIGAASIEQRCIRPYATDESMPIVRVTSNVQRLLGVEDTDDVIIRFRGHSFKARVMEFHSLELTKETNVVGSEGDLNLCIGIPSYMRSRLKIESVGYVCTLHRDTQYLFFKNLNIQLIPILGVVLAVFQLPISWAVKCVLIGVLTPIAIFFTFSRERAKVGVGKSNEAHEGVRAKK